MSLFYFSLLLCLSLSLSVSVSLSLPSSLFQDYHVHSLVVAQVMFVLLYYKV